MFAHDNLELTNDVVFAVVVSVTSLVVENMSEARIRSGGRGGLVRVLEESTLVPEDVKCLVSEGVHFYTFNLLKFPPLFDGLLEVNCDG